VTHERHHENVAYEIFYPTGPFRDPADAPGTRSPSSGRSQPIRARR
jgi:hypothetical protein